MSQDPYLADRAQDPSRPRDGDCLPEGGIKDTVEDGHDQIQQLEQDLEVDLCKEEEGESLHPPEDSQLEEANRMQSGNMDTSQESSSIDSTYDHTIRHNILSF